MGGSEVEGACDTHTRLPRPGKGCGALHSWTHVCTCDRHGLEVTWAGCVHRRSPPQLLPTRRGRITPTWAAGKEPDPKATFLPRLNNNNNNDNSKSKDDNRSSNNNNSINNVGIFRRIIINDIKS